MIPMIQAGYNTILLRDLTEAFVPDVYREEGLRLSVKYIERFIAPTASVDQILNQKESNG